MFQKPIIIELDRQIYLYKKGSLEALDKLPPGGRDAWYITDMGDAITRMETVDAPAKYADVIIKKSLQEAGEFAGPVTAIPLWKKKRSASSSQVLYTALSATGYSYYADMPNNTTGNMLVFPLYQLLLSILWKYRLKNPSALIFQHGRFADIIIATSSQVLYANRCVAFDDSPEQIAALWQTVQNDLSAASTDKRITIDKTFALNWVSSTMPSGADNHLEITPLPESSVLFNGKSVSLSFIRALKSLRPWQSISSPATITGYFANRVYPALVTLIVLLSVGLVGGFFYVSKASQNSQSAVKTLEREIEQIQSVMPKSAEDIGEFKETVAFINELNNIRLAPAFKDIVNDISAERPQTIKINDFNCTYEKDRVVIELAGDVNAAFDRANTDYRQFLRRMKNKGYAIPKSQFNTQIRNSKFYMRMERPFA